MIAFYAEIKWVHVVAVMCSGALFLLRGTLAQTGQIRWARHAALRYLSYSIDSVLLTAALMLLTVLPAAMFSNGWLVVKLLLLVVYIALGVIALRPSSSRRSSAICFVLALAVYGFMATIARSHHPLGALHWLS